MTQAKKQRGHTVAITGAGSGLGRELALGLSAKDYRVFGTAHSANETTEIQNQSADDGGEIILTITDITKEEQINNWKDQGTKLLNGDGLDLLINNAGGILVAWLPSMLFCHYYVRQKVALFKSDP